MPSTVRVRASITEIRSAAVLATNTRRPSGEIAIPTGVEPTARLATRRRVPVSNTLTRLLPEFDTHARRPSGVKRIRIGSPALAITARTVSARVSITLRVLASRFATHTSPPSGAMSMPSAPAPVGIEWVSPLTRSIAVQLPDAMFATYSLRSSRLATSMWLTSWPVGHACAMRFETLVLLKSKMLGTGVVSP